MKKENLVADKVNKETAKKILEVVDAGLVSGMGIPTPGKMCVEAAGSLGATVRRDVSGTIPRTKTTNLKNQPNPRTAYEMSRMWVRFSARRRTL